MFIIGLLCALWLLWICPAPLQWLIVWGMVMFLLYPAVDMWNISHQAEPLAITHVGMWWTSIWVLIGIWSISNYRREREKKTKEAQLRAQRQWDAQVELIAQGMERAAQRVKQGRLE